ncbi:MAG TPA: hypothetical protein V6C78_19350 [Crinalium sp.]
MSILFSDKRQIFLDKAIAPNQSTAADTNIPALVEWLEHIGLPPCTSVMRSLQFWSLPIGDRPLADRRLSFGWCHKLI